MVKHKLPLPLIITGGAFWGGNDGNWSTIQVGVGTPRQYFDVLPSTTIGETWVVIPEGCPSSIPDCALLRGLGAAGVRSEGFQSNESTTWSQIGLYGLTSEDNLFSSQGGFYGLDTVAIDVGETDALSNQTVAGIVTADFWLGVLGLGKWPSQFSVLENEVPSLLASMKSQNLTASMSYGFTAGAYYRSSPVSLIIGGYNQAIFDSSTIEVPINGTGNRALSVSLQSVIVSHGIQGTVSVTDSERGMMLGIDSAVSQLWLPQSLCDQFVDAFGLIYDPSTTLYLVNETIHQELVNLSPQITLTLGASATSNVTTNVIFPYAAFDLEVSLPYYNGTQRYFPIRRAANDSQLTLGRVFLQEAYLAVDWERGNFTLGQRSHDSNAMPSIIPIPPVADKKAQSLSPGAIAGVTVAGASVCILLAVAFLFRRRRKSKRIEQDSWVDDFPKDKKSAIEQDQTAELHGSHITGVEILSTQLYEVHGEAQKQQLMSDEVFELPGHSVECELAAGGDIQADEKLLVHEKSNAQTK